MKYVLYGPTSTVYVGNKAGFHELNIALMCKVANQKMPFLNADKIANFEARSLSFWLGAESESI